MDTIAVIIPCYNEEQTIQKVVADYRAALPEAVVYVYDNNSTDRTAVLAAGAGAVVRHEPLQGKSNVVRSMLRDIDAACYLMVDGDDTYPAENARDLCAPILDGTCDMVVGDRLSSTYFTENTRPFHNFGNTMVLRCIQTLWKRNGGSAVLDVMSGMRAMSPLFVQTFPVLTRGFELETEMTIFALENRFRITSIPVQYRDRPRGSTSKLNTFRDGFKVLGTILRMFCCYRPLRVFGGAATGMALLSLLLFVPVFGEYLATGLVPKFPTLIVSGLLMLGSMLSLATGILMDFCYRLHRQRFEMTLNGTARELSRLRR